MKRKITLLLLAAASVFSVNSQVVLQENFTATFNPTSAGWNVQNLSSPIGALNWFQGNPNAFSAYNGNPNDYFAVNYNSKDTANVAGGISDWLITPTLTIYNGAVIQFATRTANTGSTNVRPDALQLRMSTSGTNIAISTGTASVGPFTNLLFDINPSLSTSTNAAVSNGSVVNGYPNSWTVYSVQVTGVTGTVTGAFAFRYVVNNGGLHGANSNYIGIDAVKYTLPCAPTVQSYTTCAGVATTLQAVGLPATTYSWNNGSTSSAITVSPNVTTVYTVYPSNGNISCGTSVTATITVGPQMVVGASSNTTTICSGNSVTLTANAPSNTFSWTIGTTPVGSGSTLVVTPTTTTTYSVGAQNGNCIGFNGITINVNASPTLSLSINPTPVCLGATSMTITTSGANTYTYVLSNVNVTTNPLTSVTVPTVAGSYQFGIFGTGANGCVSGGTATFAVNPNPTVSVSSPSANACTNSTINITASGASSYSWSGAATSTTNPLTYSTGATAGVKTFSVVGTSSLGCKATVTFTQNVIVCAVGIPDINGEYEGVSVFPNPFTSEINITSLEGRVIIYNAVGQEVMNVLVNSSEIINTADLPKGVYMVKAYNGQGELAKTVKLIKN